MSGPSLFSTGDMPVDQETLERNLASAERLRYLAVAGVTIVYWEHLNFLPSEFLVWRRVYRCILSSTSFVRAPWSRLLNCLLLLLLRYTLLVSATLLLVSTVGRPATCLDSPYWLFYVLITLCSGILFGIRVVYIWDRDMRIAILLALLLALSLVFQVAAFTTYHNVRIPELAAPGQGWCFDRWKIGEENRKWPLAVWGVTSLFDLAVVVLTLIRLRQVPVRSTRLRRYIVRSNILYFAAAFAFNLGALINVLAGRNSDDKVVGHFMEPIALGAAPLLAIRIAFGTQAVPRLDPSSGKRRKRRENLAVRRGGTEADQEMARVDAGVLRPLPIHVDSTKTLSSPSTSSLPNNVSDEKNVVATPSTTQSRSQLSPSYPDVDVERAPAPSTGIAGRRFWRRNTRSGTMDENRDGEPSIVGRIRYAASTSSFDEESSRESDDGDREVLNSRTRIGLRVLSRSDSRSRAARPTRRS